MKLKELIKRLGAFDENMTVGCIFINAEHNVIVMESIHNDDEKIILKQYESEDGVVYYTPVFDE